MTNEELLNAVHEGKYINVNGIMCEKIPSISPYDFDEYIQWIGSKFSIEKETSITSESLYENNPDKYNLISMKLWGNKGLSFDNRTPKDIEKFLTLYFDYDIVLECVERTMSVDNKEPIWIFFCHRKEKEETLENDEFKKYQLKVLDMHKGYNNNSFGKAK